MEENIKRITEKLMSKVERDLDIDTEGRGVLGMEKLNDDIRAIDHLLQIKSLFSDEREETKEIQENLERITEKYLNKVEKIIDYSKKGIEIKTAMDNVNIIHRLVKMKQRLNDIANGSNPKGYILEGKYQDPTRCIR
jgi:hypothetical protein